MLNKNDVIELIELEEKTDYQNGEEMFELGNKEAEMQEYFQLKVDEFITEIANHFELKTGDVTPMQVNVIDEFGNVLKDYVYNNVKDNI